MSLSRRAAIGLAAAGAALPLADAWGQGLRSALAEKLAMLTDPVSGAAPAAGVLVRRRGETILAETAGAAQLPRPGGGEPTPFKTNTKFRVASISKMATALIARRLAQEGRIDLDADVARLFEPALRHPSGEPITLRRLLSHTSGIADPAVYWMAAPGRTEDLFTPNMFAQGAPGRWFQYANFNYGLAAHVLETAAGERFDLLAQVYALAPLGLTAGFNWSGVPAAEQRAGATLYRGKAGAWAPQIDDDTILQAGAPALLAEPGFDLSTYRPGANGTLFSPQGGLRASLEDLAVIAETAGADPEIAAVQWRFDRRAQNGVDEGGYFRAFGVGVQIWDPALSPWPGVRLIGHPGEAYGLYAGAWHVPDYDAQIVYAVTGGDPARPWAPSANPAFTQVEITLFNAGRAALEAG